MQENNYCRQPQKTDVSHHVAVAIIKHENRGEFLFDLYGENYALIDYHGRINLIGGNHNYDDLSPWNIWKREIEEEFSDENFKEKGEELSISDKPMPKIELVPIEIINSIRMEIIKNARPYKDFYFETPPLRMMKEGKIIILPTGKCVYSVFLTEISPELFNEAGRFIKDGKAIKQEGFGVIRSIDDLISGKAVCAAGSGLIMKDFLGVNIPNPDGAKLEYIGMPRKNMEQYLREFNYLRPVRSVMR